MKNCKANSISKLIKLLIGYVGSLNKRTMGMLCFVSFLVYCGVTSAQLVTIPDPNWPLDSVINQSVHKYTVEGDQNYEAPSSFVWTVEGGRLFYDQNLTTMVGNGISDTVVGNSGNVSELWVVWDSFNQPLDTGYIYAYEISWNGCQRADTDPEKFRGLRIKVSAPPDVYFLKDVTNTCSNEEGVNVDIIIDGMPPFDLTYSINGVDTTLFIEEDDLLDYNGELSYISILIDDYTGTTVDKVYELVLIEASSGGVKGSILQYPSHTVNVFVQPDAPSILPQWSQVTATYEHTYSLTYEGESPIEWFWELLSDDGSIVFNSSSTIGSSVLVPFNVSPGYYNLVSYYLSSTGCISLGDTLGIRVFDMPTIAFSDSTDNVVGCSAVSLNPDESFEFTLDYKGALSYNFSYIVYDYNNNVVGGDTLRYQIERNVVINIPNTFINDELPEIDRVWRVVITDASNDESVEVGVEVEILDSDIDGGRDERTIRIHPKPSIYDDIDFYN